MAPEAAAHLEAALNIMEATNIDRLQLDWEQMRATAARLAGGGQAPANTCSGIQYVLRKAGGHHSFFLMPKQATALGQSPMADNPPPRAKLLLDRLGYVAICGFGSPDPREGSKYTTLVQQLIRELDAQSSCGWIVDLRENTGGNMWPMLAGLGPVGYASFSTTMCLYTHLRDGAHSSAAEKLHQLLTTVPQLYLRRRIKSGKTGRSGIRGAKKREVISSEEGL
jgi:hypothetical protein